MAITTATCACAKRQHTKCYMDEFRATGGGFAKIFDL